MTRNLNRAFTYQEKKLEHHSGQIERIGRRVAELCLDGQLQLDVEGAQAIVIQLRPPVEDSAA